MSPSPLILKNPHGWFAAGVEVERALRVLSDGAFKLFVYLCLHARRDTRILETSQRDLSRNLKKSPGSIRRYLRQLEAEGVCRMRFSRNPLERGVLAIDESFWPYQQAGKAAPNEAADAFVAAVKQILQARACVQTSFPVSDEILARDWFTRSIPLERIEQAILLGCTRKYMSWRNHQTRTPIVSLQYFEPLLSELETQVIKPDYWEYLRYRMERMETLWKESHDASPSPAQDPAPQKTDRSTDGNPATAGEQT